MEESVMQIVRYAFLGVLIGLFLTGNVFSQNAGDYRSLTTGDWSAATTWETFDGSNWVAASTAPAGTETITVDDADTVRVDVAVTIAGTGYVMVTNTGIVDVTAGALTFGDGSTYEHARDGGSVPVSTWDTGSTALFTGITSNTPANRGQDYYNLTLNTPGLSSNKDMDLVNVTIGGDITVVNTGSARWRMVGGDSTTITIMGDVDVEGGSFETQGTSSPTVVEILQHGDLNITGGVFGISRGSQGSVGTTTWNLLEGNLLVSDAELRNSNSTPGNAKFVFARADTQQITFNNVTYGGGDIHFEISDVTTLQITQDLVVNGLLINKGDIDQIGTLTFTDGGVYEHARDGGTVPTATWETGSTALFTGITTSAPDNRGQDYYNLTLNTPGLLSNSDLDLVDKTISGDITVINTGSARWRLVGGDTATVTIMGDVIVQGGSFETLGTGSPTVVEVNHYGNVLVTGGTFAVSRGSQGNGQGSTTWNLFEGNLSVSNAALRNSNPTPGNAKFVFAKSDTQQITFENVDYAGGDIHFKVADSTTLQITQDMDFNGLVINEGTIYAVGTPTFIDGGIYEHARDGGSVPVSIWDTGSTALFTGIINNTPANRGQDYYNLTLNTPDLSSNRDMDLIDHTIGGDLTLLNSGSSRWRLVGGDSGTVTIMGDVIVEDGSLETQGTSSPTVVEVLHHGDVKVTGGTFAVSRGSQGGVGSTRWYLLEADSFSIADAITRNSNPDGATFVFAREGGIQNITLTNVTYESGGLPIEVDSAATLNTDTTVIGGEGNFVLSAGATLATAHPGGLDGTLQMTGDTTLSKQANFTFNGTEAQVPGVLLPDTIGTLTIANPAGVSFDDTLTSSQLMVSTGAMMNIDSLGSVTSDSGTVAGTVVNKGALEAAESIVFADGSVYEHARDGGDVPTGVWETGSTALFTGITTSTPGNRGQDYYNLTLNTPDLLSNRDMSLVDVTIGGDITVISSGSSRWRLVGGDTTTITIMGDVIVQDGSLETQGTSSPTVVVVNHYGDVVVTGGTFAVSRGSQGSGTGSTRWYMHEGNFSVSDAHLRNSNPTNAWFVFDKDTTQTVTLNNVR
jgi:S-formylglutathione hydrolase FrmB